MTPAAGHDAAWRAMVEAASAPYRASGRFPMHFARGKLGDDPVFRHTLERGLIAPGSRVLDVGCGQGLLASLLRVAGAEAQAGRWPAGWAPAPVGARVTGIELLEHDVVRARAALGSDATILHGDMRTTQLPPADTVVFFDALHYIAPAEQDEVLARARAALGPGGSLLLRVMDADARRRYQLGQFIDRVTMLLRGGGFHALTGRPVAQWKGTLARLGFEVETFGMSGRPPFVNRLLVARVPVGVAA